MDDFGFKLIETAKSENSLQKSIGNVLVQALPKVIRLLTVVGTLAMILVAGGIFTHNVHQIHDFLHVLPSIVAELLVGLAIGTVAVLVHGVFVKLVKNK
jgi:predicted DNA repair protein MutK